MKTKTTFNYLMILISLGFMHLACQNEVSETTQESTEQVMKPKVVEGVEIFTVVEQPPQIIGGMEALSKEIVYPEKAKEEMLEGKVFVSFIVDENGDVLEPVIQKSPSYLFDEAAINAVKDLKFVPGEQRGKKVKVKYTLPIVFKLQ